MSKEDIRPILERATLHERSYICLPEHAEGYTMSVPDKDSYNKVEINELVEWIYKVIRTSDDYHSKRLDDVYYPFENNISWLTTRRDEMKQNLAMLQKQHGVGTRISTLIDDSIQTSINARFTSFKDRLQSFTYRLDGV